MSEQVIIEGLRKLAELNERNAALQVQLREQAGDLLDAVQDVQTEIKTLAASVKDATIAHGATVAVEGGLTAAYRAGHQRQLWNDDRLAGFVLSVVGAADLPATLEQLMTVKDYAPSVSIK